LQTLELHFPDVILCSGWQNWHSRLIAWAAFTLIAGFPFVDPTS
jgi:hypothetical protein